MYDSVSSGVLVLYQAVVFDCGLYRENFALNGVSAVVLAFRHESGVQGFESLF
jgi:hypothetical protein